MSSGDSNGTCREEVDVHNSLDRLLTGMATAMHERVLPALDDSAAIAQVRALVELLGNLSTRVVWDPSHLVEVRARVRPALVALEASGAGLPGLQDVLDRGPVDPLDGPALRQDVIDHLDVLAAGQDWMGRTAHVPVATEEAVDAFVDWHLAEEMARLRSASFGRPREGA